MCVSLSTYIYLYLYRYIIINLAWLTGSSGADASLRSGRFTRGTPPRAERAAVNRWVNSSASTATPIRRS